MGILIKQLTGHFQVQYLEIIFVCKYDMFFANAQEYIE